MALTVSSGLTEIDDCDTDNWTGDPSIGLDTDFQIEGTGCIGMDVDIETIAAVSSSFTAADYSSRILYFWLFSFTASTLDTKAAGGMQIGVQDGSGNQSFWYVGGSDNYSGGWEVFSANLATTPDRNNGTNATLTNVTNVVVAFKNTAKSKLTQNCFVDWCRYGTLGAPALTISGTNTTAGDGWSEVQSGDDTGVYGIIREQKGSYILKGPIQFGDSAGTATTDFTDYVGSSVIFDDQPVGDSHYNITIAGNGTGTTDFQLGSVVGTGDDRQGLLGTSISTIGPLWEWDSDTDIADLDGVELYGCRFTGAGQGIQLDDNTKTTVISTSFINCGAVAGGTVGGGAVILNCNIIDPDGATNNYGLHFNQTPSGGTLTHNYKNISFITSGTPTTQYMLYFSDASDYSVSVVGFNMFGSYTSGTLWHGINTGSNADVTINASDSTLTQAEFSSTASGTVTVNNNVSVTFSGLIANSEVRIYRTSDGAELDGIENSGTSFTASIAATTGVYYTIHNVLYEHIRVEGFTWPSTTTTIPIQQRFDANYVNNAVGTFQDISVVGSDTQDGGASATSVTFSEPTGTAEGDLLIAIVKCDDTTAGWTDPTDWTQLDDVSATGNQRIYIGYKLRGSTAGQALTFSHSGVSTHTGGALAVYRGVDAASPLDVTYSNASHETESLNDLSYAPSTITTVTNKARVVIMQGWSGGNGAGTPAWATISGWAVDANLEAGSGRNANLISLTQPIAGLLTPGSYQTTGDTGEDGSSYTIAIRPAAA